MRARLPSTLARRYRPFQLYSTEASPIVPIIDFGRFLHGSEAEKAEVAKEMGEVCERIGFFAIKNHGVPEVNFESFTFCEQHCEAAELMSR